MEKEEGGEGVFEKCGMQQKFFNNFIFYCDFIIVLVVVVVVVFVVAIELAFEVMIVIVKFLFAVT